MARGFWKRPGPIPSRPRMRSGVVEGEEGAQPSWVVAHPAIRVEPMIWAQRRSASRRWMGEDVEIAWGWCIAWPSRGVGRGWCSEPVLTV